MGMDREYECKDEGNTMKNHKWTFAVLCWLALVLVMAGPSWGASWRQLTVQEEANLGATHSLDLSFADLTVSATNTPQSITNNCILAGQALQPVAMILDRPFRDASYTTYVPTLALTVGDSATGNKYITSTQIGTNGAVYVKQTLTSLAGPVTAPTAATTNAGPLTAPMANVSLAGPLTAPMANLSLAGTLTYTTTTFTNMYSDGASTVETWTVVTGITSTTNSVDYVSDIASTTNSIDYVSDIASITNVTGYVSAMTSTTNSVSSAPVYYYAAATNIVATFTPAANHNLDDMDEGSLRILFKVLKKEH